MKNNSFSSQIEKNDLIESIKLQKKVRIFLLAGIFIVLFYLNFSVFSDLSLRLVSGLVIAVNFIFLAIGKQVIDFPQKQNSEDIRQTFINIYCLEVISSALFFYVLIPFTVTYSFPLIYIIILFFSFYLIFTHSFLKEEVSQRFLFLLTWLILILLTITYYSSFEPEISYKISPAFLNHFLVPIILSTVAIFSINYIGFFFKQRPQRLTKNLKKLNQGLERRLRETKEDLYEMQQKIKEQKQVSLIKERAHNRQLKELAQQLRYELGGAPPKNNDKNNDRHRDGIKKMSQTTSALLNILEDNEKARKTAEKEQRKTAAIINNFVDGLITLDENNKISVVNPKAKEKFNLKDVSGRPISVLEDNELMKPILEVIMEGDQIKEVEKRRIELEPETTIEITTVLIGETPADQWLIVLRDVSRDVLIQKMKTEFVTVAAHQLRTPLSAVKWSLSMLEEAGDLNKKQKKILEKTYKSNEKLINLINDLLSVSQIEEGRFLGKTKEQSLIPVVREVIENHEAELEKENIDLQFKVKLAQSEKMPLVEIDQEKMKIALDNLITNAINYSPEGEKVMVSLEQQEEELKLMIKDNGIGIPKEQQKRVFERFFRAKNALKKITEGSGLGLFITNNIIEAHNGDIWFESKEGQGTTFYVTLPISNK